MKYCYRCKQELPESAFGKNKAKKDGLSTECKQCKKICDAEYHKRNRVERLVSMKKYRKENYEILHPKELEYARSDRGREANRKATKRYYLAHKEKISQRQEERNKRDKDKYQCRYTFTNAIKLGKVERPCNCQQCSIECTPDGHHSDYSKPFEVQWLCKSCHGKMHRKVGD
jgi:hypothetical protein